jgi:hypothetical protein
MHRLIIAALSFSLVAAAPVAPPPAESCAMKKSRDVSFRAFNSKDVLEVEINEGACLDVKLYIYIRTDKGEILYKYEAPLEQHLVIAGDPISVEAKRFVDGILQEGMLSTESLPPWQERDAYEQEHQSVIFLSKEEYERLRAKPRPMLSHPTYHEGWVTVVYDAKERAAAIVLEGGT